MKAWVCYGLASWLRISQIIQEEGGWFGPKRRCEGDVKDLCIGDYNENLASYIATPANWCLHGLVILSAILVCITFKYRKLISYFFALECLIRFCAVLVPTSAGYRYDGVKYLYTFGINFFCYYTGSGY